MAISIICTNKDPKPWRAALEAIDSSVDIQVWPNETRKDEVEFALCWKHPKGALQDYPNLRCICSMGAGIDHLLADPSLPKHLPVIRLVDPALAQSMFEYITATAMYYLREFDSYRAQQDQALWQQNPPITMANTTIGVMGLGEIGQVVATQLSALGFSVTGWARTEKSIVGVKTYAGYEQLEQFASMVDILICLLPLTDQTQGILNQELFNNMPAGSCLIQVARGEHLAEQDLLDALNSGQLRGAWLDVFNEEPLPTEHPFWKHEKIMITPHCSSLTEPASVAPQIIQNYRLMQLGEPLLNQVDIQRGY